LRRAEKLGLIAGLLLLAYLVYLSDPRLLWEYLARVQWGLLLLLAITAVRHAVRTLACRLVLGEDRGQISFATMYAVLLVSEAVKFVLVAAGILGEAARVALIRHRVTGPRAVSSVLLDVLLFNLTSVLLLLGGTALFFARVPDARSVRNAGAIGAAVIAGVTLLLFVALQQRWLTASRFASAIAGTRSAWLHGARQWVGRHREKFRETDAQLFDFYARHPGLFFGNFLLNLLSQGFAALEVFAVFGLLGLPLGPVEAVALEALKKLSGIAGFVVPGSLGVYEGGLALVSQALGMSVAAGVAIGLVRKMRAIVWAALGFAVLAWWRRGESSSTGGSRP